jgi:hypothetical protein
MFAPGQGLSFVRELRLESGRPASLTVVDLADRLHRFPVRKERFNLPVLAIDLSGRSQYHPPRPRIVASPTPVSPGLPDPFFLRAIRLRAIVSSL